MSYIHSCFWGILNSRGGQAGKPLSNNKIMRRVIQESHAGCEDEANCAGDSNLAF